MKSELLAVRVGFLSCLLLIWVCAGGNRVLAASADLEADLAAMDSMREASIELAGKPLADVSAKYREALEKRMASAQAAGDLDGVIAARNELGQLAAGGAEGEAPKNPELARLRQAYQDQVAKASVQVTSKILEIERSYSAGLEKMAADLTKAGKPDDAKLVRDRKDAFIRDFVTRRQKGGLVGNTSRKAGDEQQFEIGGGMKVAFCWIPPGEFMMGGRVGELGEKTKEGQHSVRITKGYWMAKTELTSAQWEAVMGNRPGHRKEDDYPVEQVNWFDICGDAKRGGGFLAKASLVAPKGWRFDLPTEAEWEYACRAGTVTALSSGDDLLSLSAPSAALDKLGWYDKNSGGGTHPVAKKQPNKWGLHDMHGNVWEWCSDWSGEYPMESVTDPTGPENAAERVIRGGGWRHDSCSTRSSHRNHFRPDIRYLTVGFRPILRSTAEAVSPALAKSGQPVKPVEEKPVAKTGDTKTVSRNGMVKTAGLDASVPPQTGPPPAFVVKTVSEDPEKSAYVYASAHFEFVSDRRLTDRVVSGFGLLYEATYAAVLAMPWDAKFDSNTSNGLFTVALFSQEKDYLKEGGIAGSAGTAVGPVSLVLLEHLGVKDTGSRLILEDIKENHVVIHELTHALRDNADSKMPIWAIEGFAEYVASAPYQRTGRFSFKDRLSDAADYVRKNKGVDDVFKAPLSLEELLGASRDLFYGDSHGALSEGSLGNYASALLVMVYFWHEDQGKSGTLESGTPIRAWLKAIRDGKSEKDARPLLLDGRSYPELEKAISKSIRRKIDFEFGDS